MGKLIDFIKKKNIKESEFFNMLFDLNDEISDELSGKFSGNGIVPDELYLGAEFMSDVGMKALYNICYNLVLRRYGQPYNCDFKKEFNIFEKELDKLFKKAVEFELHYSDDGWYYSINSLDLPNKLLNFCDELDGKFYDDNDINGCYGKNNCYDIKKMILDSEICFDTITICAQYEFLYKQDMCNCYLEYNDKHEK